MTSAAASMGMIMLWNVDEGLNQIDKFFHSPEDYIKAGGCLAIGIVSSGIRNETDAALALLSDYVENPNASIKSAAISGLGIAYAGAQKEEVQQLLLPTIENSESTITEVRFFPLLLIH